MTFCFALESVSQEVLGEIFVLMTLDECEQHFVLQRKKDCICVFWINARKVSFCMIVG